MCDCAETKDNVKVEGTKMNKAVKMLVEANYAQGVVRNLNSHAARGLDNTTANLRARKEKYGTNAPKPF